MLPTHSVAGEGATEDVNAGLLESEDRHRWGDCRVRYERAFESDTRRQREAMSAKALVANVLPVRFEFENIELLARDIIEDDDLAGLRESLAPEWSVQWEGGKVYFLRLADGGAEVPNVERATLVVRDNLRLLARLTTDSLVRRFPTYEPLRRKPFTFVGRKQQLMDGVGELLGMDDPLLNEFRVWPKYALDARVTEVRAGEPFVGLTVDLATRWEITADLTELQRAGIDLTGLFVVRRNPDPDLRPLVGRIGTIHDGVVKLSESTTDDESVPATSVMLEGRRDAFARCLRPLLGSKFTRYDEYRDRKVGDLLGGPHLLAEVERVAKVLSDQPLELAQGLTCSVEKPLRIANSSDYRSIVGARQLDYCFDAARTKRDKYAWAGLERYGPFSRDTFARPSPNVLVVFPQAAQGAVEKFVRHLRDGIAGQKAYQAGLTKTFGLVNPRFEMVGVSQSDDQTPADAYRRTIESALARGDLPDVALIIVSDRDGDLPDDVNPYLHSKAMLLMAGVATQHARLSKISSPVGSLQYILQNISIALYAKLRGVPWTVDHDLTIADELVIGIGTAEMSDSRINERHRYVGITTVFRGDGNYLLGQLSREANYDEYPAVLRDSTREILEELKLRNGWQPGDTVRVVIHAARPPRNVDFARLIRDAVQAVGKDQHVEFAFVTVSHDHPYTLFDTAQQGRQTPRGVKGEFVPERGLIVQTNRYSRLITTTGLTLVKRPGLPLARPIQVHLHQHSTFTDLHYLSEQVLKFTALSWRSTTPARDPVTIYYSELIARHLARLRAVPGWSANLLDSRLRTSKWFL